MGTAHIKSIQVSHDFSSKAFCTSFTQSNKFEGNLLHVVRYLFFSPFSDGAVPIIPFGDINILLIILLFSLLHFITSIVHFEKLSEIAVVSI